LLNAGFILSGKHGKHGKVREFKVIWKTHGKVREISKKSRILTFFWKIINFNTNIKKNPF
jgi:saccharopine dehydrogenase-like NADP-dependent oxidoreductase